MSYTVEAITDSIIEKLKNKSKWKNTLFYGSTYNLMKAISFGINRRAVYPAEQYYSESFLKTATRYDSVLPRSEVLSYIAHRKKGASGNIIFSGDSLREETAPAGARAGLFMVLTASAHDRRQPVVSRSFVRREPTVHAMNSLNR